MRNLLKIISTAAGLGFALGVGSSWEASAANTTWPVITPIHMTYEWINPGKAGVDTPFMAYIQSPSGQSLYKLECHNSEYEDDSEIDYSGVFQCALFALQGQPNAFVDLLAADTHDELSTDWWNRGRVMAYQFQEPCIDFPEYSTTRHFRLRSMVVTLGFTNIEWSSTIPKNIVPEKFTMTLDVVPDTKATATRAALPAAPAPPKGCYP